MLKNPVLKSLLKPVGFTYSHPQVSTLAMCIFIAVTLEGTKLPKQTLESTHLFHMPSHTDGRPANWHTKIAISPRTEDRRTYRNKFFQLASTLFATTFRQLDIGVLLIHAGLCKSFKTQGKLPKCFFRILFRQSTMELVASPSAVKNCLFVCFILINLQIIHTAW